MGFQLQLLGIPRFAVDGRTVAVSWPRRSLSLLSYLVTAQSLVARDAVAFALWPDDDEEAARGNLRRNLNVLRGALLPQAANWIIVDPGSIGFDHAAANLDVAAFEAFAADPATYVEAVKTYRGDFAAPLYDPWALVERERLRARFHAILAELISTSFSARRFEEALDYARRITADEPFREDVVRRIIAIRYAMGDRPGALAEFERFRRALQHEMNVEPMPETWGLHDLVMRGDPLPFAPDVHVGGERDGAAPATLLPFGGRQAALTRLRSAWEVASTTSGALIFVSGEAGIGKTRIVAEALERVVGSSARILRGATGSPETRPFEALLAALAQTAPFLASMQIEPVWLNVLAPLVPQLDARVRDALIAPLPPERETLRLFDAFAKLLAAVARARPVVVVLEDLHWAGPATLAAIRHLATRIRGHRILVIVTYRDGEGRAVEPLRRDLCASGHADSVTLTRLPHDDLLGILAQLRPPPSADEARSLAARSEGNPLFLTELMREYPASLTGVATGIAEVVSLRLAHASADAQRLAYVAAICGSTFDLDLLRAVVGWTDGAIIDGIAELLERGFVRSTATHERGSYAFTHALVRGAVVAGAPADEQRRIHHIVARALETRSAGPLYAVEIALHWQAASEFERAARAYADAAQASLRAHARDEAAALARSGETLATDPRLRFELVRIRIVANLRRATTDTLHADAARLATIALALDDDARYEAALLACRVDQIGSGDPGREDHIEALRCFRDDVHAPRRSAEIAEVESVNELHLGNVAAAISAAERARDGYRELGAVGDELRAAISVANMHAGLFNAHVAFTHLAPLEARVVALAEPLVLMEYWRAYTSAAHARYDSEAMLRGIERWHTVAHDIGDRLMEAHAAWMAGCAHGLAVRLTHAFRETERAKAIYASIGATDHLHAIENNRAAYLMQTGRIAEATAVLLESLTYARSNGRLESEYFLVSNLGVAQLAAGDAAAAVGTQREALRLARQLTSEGYEALVLGDLGDAQAATGAIAEGVAHLLRAAAMHQTLLRPSTRAHDLARAARWEPAADRAASLARQALAIVEADGDGIKNAPEILWCCTVAFERAGESTAAAYARGRGRGILERRAAAIEDPEDRRYYCDLPYHRALLGELAAH